MKAELRGEVQGFEIMLTPVLPPTAEWAIRDLSRLVERCEVNEKNATARFGDGSNTARLSRKNAAGFRARIEEIKTSAGKPLGI